MGNAICKTCGGVMPNHKPSMFDKDGMGHPDHRMTNSKDSSSDLQENIEDWLDNAAHSDRLPVKINFSDIQKIAEILAPLFTQERNKVLDEIAERLNKLYYNNPVYGLPDEQIAHNEAIDQVKKILEEVRHG